MQTIKVRTLSGLTVWNSIVCMAHCLTQGCSKTNSCIQPQRKGTQSRQSWRSLDSMLPSEIINLPRHEAIVDWSTHLNPGMESAGLEYGVAWTEDTHVHN